MEVNDHRCCAQWELGTKPCLPYLYPVRKAHQLILNGQLTRGSIAVGYIIY